MESWRNGKSDEELREAIKKEIEYAISMVFLHIDLVRRLHEVRHHGRDGSEEDLRRMMLDAQDKFINFFVETELAQLEEVIVSKQPGQPKKDGA